LFVLFLVAVVWLAVATEPRRRAAYLADCQTKGFSAQQCTFLYSERHRRDADAAAALAAGAAALAGSASPQIARGQEEADSV
jgi:hypothetical protein